MSFLFPYVDFIKLARRTQRGRDSAALAGGWYAATDSDTDTYVRRIHAGAASAAVPWQGFSLITYWHAITRRTQPREAEWMCAHFDRATISLTDVHTAHKSTVLLDFLALSALLACNTAASANWVGLQVFCKIVKRFEQKLVLQSCTAGINYYKCRLFLIS